MGVIDRYSGYAYTEVCLNRIAYLLCQSTRYFTERTCLDSARRCEYRRGIPVQCLVMHGGGVGIAYCAFYVRNIRHDPVGSCML